MNVKDTKSPAWHALVKLGDEIDLSAGIFEEEGAAPKKRSDGRDSKLTLIDIATIHEFGGILRDADGNKIGEIPQRSFIRAWFDANQERIQAEFVRRLDANPPDKWPQALDQLALWIEAELKRNVRRGIPPPLSDATKHRKKSSTPLIDTSQLVNAIMARINGKKPQ